MVICSSCPRPPNKIDFEDLKWGSFTKQFQAYKRQVPSSSIDNLGEFADYVLAHPQHFKKTTERRARFYKNVIDKKGGSNSTYSPAYTPPHSSDMNTEAMAVFMGMGGATAILFLISKYGIPAVREIIANTARAMGFRGNQVGIEEEVLDQVENDTETDLESVATGNESDTTGNGRRMRGGDAGEKTPAPWEIQRERERAEARAQALLALLNPPTPPPPPVLTIIPAPPPPPVADPIYDSEGRPRTRARTRLQPRALFRGNDTPLNNLRRPREDDDEQPPPAPPLRANGRRVGGRDYSKDEGKSLGFFGNIQRAFDTSYNKKPTEKEKPILKGIFGAEKVLTDNLIKPLAPPVGIVAEKQRQFLENKYGGMVRRYM
jgi:hypothetical protein